MRHLLGFTLAFCVIASLNSCSMEDEPILDSNEVIANEDNDKEEVGRFDNELFKWDYTFSTDSTLSSDENLLIYPVKIDESKVSRNGGGRILISESSTEDILITDPNIIYVGAAFPESEFGKGFGQEIVFPRNPIDVVTSLADVYIGYINRETGSIGYRLFIKELLHSDEYRNYVQEGLRESLSFSCSEFYSYSDIEKAFASNAGLGKIFATKVKNNSKKQI